MKKNILIIVLLLVSLLMAFCLTSKAQYDPYDSKGFECKNSNVVYKDKPKRSLIADETYLTYTKTGARIVTYSYSIFKDLSKNFGCSFERLLTHKMKDGGRLYKKYTILVSTDVGDTINEWAKQNL